MMRGHACESDLSFDLLLAGDLPEADVRRVRAHLDGCSPCARRWAELRSQRDAFEVLRPALDLTSRLRGRRWWRGSWLPAVAAIAAAAMLLVVTLRPDDGHVGVPAPGTRSKGSALFEFYIRRGDTIRRAGDTEVVYPGDQLQLVYSSPRSGFVTVLSRDGAGVTSVYVPEDGRTAWPAPAGHNQSLPRSTILDATIGRELVHALFCATAIELQPLRGDLAAGRPLRPPRGCLVETIQLDKLPGS